jgi:hypothetical protein
METRVCIKCNETKELGGFGKKTKLRYSTVCKVCENKKNWERKKNKYQEDEEYRKKFREYQNNYQKQKNPPQDKKLSIKQKKEKVILTEEQIEEKKLKRKIYERERRKRKRKTDEEYRLKRKIYERERKKIKMKTDEEYRKKQNKKRTIRIKTKRQNNPVYRLRYNLRKCIETIIREKFSETKSKTTSSIIGLEYDDFFNYIGNLFKEGMTWDNRDEWHIDHIVPLSLSQTVDEVYYLNHHTNLRPLWVKDNISKGDRIDESNIDLYNKFLKEMRNIS